MIRRDKNRIFFFWISTVEISNNLFFGNIWNKINWFDKRKIKLGNVWGVSILSALSISNISSSIPVFKLNRITNFANSKCFYYCFLSALSLQNANSHLNPELIESYIGHCYCYLFYIIPKTTTEWEAICGKLVDGWISFLNHNF